MTKTVSHVTTICFTQTWRVYITISSPHTVYLTPIARINIVITVLPGKLLFFTKDNVAYFSNGLIETSDAIIVTSLEQP